MVLTSAGEGRKICVSSAVRVDARREEKLGSEGKRDRSRAREQRVGGEACHLREWTRRWAHLRSATWLGRHTM